MTENRVDTWADSLPTDKQRESVPDWPMLAVLVALSIGLRLLLAWRPLNDAEYTDGILQLTLFSQGNPYWPPFYSMLAVGLGKLLGDLEMGGRLVSAVLGGLAIFPLCLLAHRLGGRKTAALAGLVFLVLPEPLRWGIRVMTDAPFLTLFAASTLLLMPREGETTPSQTRLVFATIVSVLAALTRYHGMLLLLPLALMIGLRLWKRQRTLVVIAAQLLWLAIPAWIFRNALTDPQSGFAHFQQFADRSGASLGLSPQQTLLAYWNLAESYLYLFPYCLTIGVFLIFLAGMFSPILVRHWGAKWFLGMFIFSLVLILGAQAAFGIFEFRYMMPLLVFVVPYAGLGLERLDVALMNRRVIAVLLYTLVLVPPVILSIASLLMQREAFADIKDASVIASRVAGPNDRIFTNEFYNAKIPVVKTSFWAGRQVLEDPEWKNFQASIMNPQLRANPLPLDQQFKPGDVVLFCTGYGAGLQLAYLGYLDRRYEYAVVENYASTIMPLLPDVMETPYAHGSPLGWFYRYQIQSMSTIVLKIRKVIAE